MRKNKTLVIILIVFILFDVLVAVFLWRPQKGTQEKIQTTAQQHFVTVYANLPGIKIANINTQEIMNELALLHYFTTDTYGSPVNKVNFEYTATSLQNPANQFATTGADGKSYTFSSYELNKQASTNGEVLNFSIYIAPNLIQTTQKTQLAKLMWEYTLMDLWYEGQHFQFNGQQWNNQQLSDTISKEAQYAKEHSATVPFTTQ